MASLSAGREAAPAPLLPSPRLQDAITQAPTTRERKGVLPVTDAAAEPMARAAHIDPPLELTAATAAAPPVPGATPTPEAAAARPSEVPKPVDQVAPTLLNLAKTKDGNQQMTIRLHPDDLGMVQVRIERTPGGMTLVQITAEKSDTLQALQRDQARLHLTLDEAGIAAAGRTVTFHIVPPASPSTDSNTPGQHGGTGQGNHGMLDADGSASGGKGDRPAPEGNRWSGASLAGGTLARGGSAAPPSGPGVHRAGLDITA